VVAGPGLVDRLLPDSVDFLNQIYWPVVVLLCVCFLATLYHVSVPVRTSWRFNLPGAALTMTIWIVGSYLLRWVLTTTAKGSTSIYGPLSAPIVVMLWLYILSIAILIGAAVNAAFDRIWPEKETARARMEVVRRLRMTALIPRLRRDEEEQERFPDAVAADDPSDQIEPVDPMQPIDSMEPLDPVDAAVAAEVARHRR
jgi:membrane protein